MDTEQAYEELPWVHKAAIGDGAPCSYYSVVRDVGDLELEEIGGMVVDESSDAVWIVELIGTDKRCGLAAMRALFKDYATRRNSFAMSPTNRHKHATASDFCQ